jgi:4'-phosphopantetheinyl transferase
MDLVDIDDPFMSLTTTVGANRGCVDNAKRESLLPAGGPLPQPGDLRVWPAGPDAPPRPSPREVHLWSARLDGISPAAEAGCLDSAELARAQRFVWSRDAIRFRNARWMCRAVLSRYLGLASAEVRYVTGPRGRPELETDGGTGLRFNMSRSGGFALLAVTSVSPVGIDVERPRAMRDRLEIARMTFHPEEWRAIASLTDGEAQAAAFYRCWTRKEAVGKGVGLGLGLAFDRFVVGVDAFERTRRVDLDPPHGPWTLMDVSTPPGIYGAVAVADAIRGVRWWSWRPPLGGTSA